ncbi:MAG: 50S ribosomal protein L11 methyltransferase [Anaerolineales bacterium]|nr:50S ribosomal protein L11 methyltransferase [Anaerolineales bacterium]
MTQFTEVSVITDGEAAEAIAEILRPFAYQDGVVLEQLGDENNLDPNALEPAVTVKIYIPENEDTPTKRQRIEEVLYYMGRLYPIPPPTFRRLVEEDWAHAWKKHYHPFRIGKRIWIQPSWIDEPEHAGDTIEPGDVVLHLDPGMAFGTGLHPTTQKCLRFLEQVVRPGMNVLDVGTGSGILAIAAVKLGAEKVVGVDTDKIAVETAVSNAAQNHVSDRFTVWQGALDSVTEKDWDIVVVNILAPVILKLLAEGDLMSYVATSVATDGWLILSGIIDQQVEAVETAVAAAGGRVCERLVVRDWVSLLVKHAAK